MLKYTKLIQITSHLTLHSMPMNQALLRLLQMGIQRIKEMHS